MQFLAILLSLLVALATAVVAQQKGHSGLLWFVIGLLLPGAGLLIAALMRPADGEGSTVPATRWAVRDNEVARRLAAVPGRSTHQIAQDLGEDDGTVARHLAALQGLGMATRDDTGRWRLTTRGADQVGTEPST